MSITTYSELQSAVASYLRRNDQTGNIPTFIAMAEARMNRDARLRTIDSIARSTLTVSSQFTALPSDFARMVNLECQSDPVSPLEYRSPQTLDTVRSQSVPGIPLYYAIIGDELEVAPIPDQSYTFGVIYYRNIAALSDSNTSNWLLSVAPDVYLYASLVESAPLLRDDDRVALWESLYNSRVQSYAESSESDQFSGSPLVMTSANIG